MKKYLVLFGAMLLAGVVLATVTPNNTDYVDYCSGPNNANCVFQVNSAGNVTGQNVTAQGNLSVTGTTAMTGAVAFSTYAGLFSGTTTQINALVAPAGAIAYCNNCNNKGICISTAAATFSFVLSTGTACK